ncbi:WD repeat domain phosphoinositide-interacting protein 4 [Fragariocoptes setiger]|uniref:WD repeat domain phosphoinositide-interacting protein 4 n=1 Tax=Fragariocoptes setiger TaxID=1670756 RepID=A0ABQ7SCR2_9ACAR|nr:WD repeat domain phosphoinositide-interacting protein 4 [Fragariocoptes setiger]
MYTASDITSLRLNQEHNLFSCCSESSCRIFNLEPLHVKLSLDTTEVGTLSICELLHRTNLMAMVAGGPRPKFADNTVLIWDDAAKRFVLELTFASTVVSLKLRRDRLLVAERNQIHCFTMPHQPKRLFTVTTRDNSQGLFEVSSYPNCERQILCFPGHKLGSVQILDLAHCEPGASSSPVYVNAHEHEIACMALNQQSTLLATASQKGTLIRVFDTTNPARAFQIVELRRGTDVATLYCLNFSHNSEFLCASSDKGTVHIFALKDVHLNRRSTFKRMSFLGNYIESQWALANFTVAAECACLCAFGFNNTVYAVCVDGTFTRYTFNLDGSCVRDAFDVFSDMATNDFDD